MKGLVQTLSAMRAQFGGFQINSGFVLLATLLLLAPGVQAAEITFVHPDHLGSPVAYTDGEGNVIGREYYTPYGESLNAPTTDNTVSYTGHYRDGDTGLIYMQARYYDPVMGRFLSVDPVSFDPEKPEHFNRYWYANGNPYLYTDPDGGESACALVSGCTPTPQTISPTEMAVGEAVIDFTPGIGDAKGIVEAVQNPTVVNVTSAVLSIAPLIGDAAGAALKGLSNALEAGADGAKSGEGFFEGAKYSDKVTEQMSNAADLHHAFPSTVDEFAGAGTVSKVTGGDGVVREKLQIPGNINGVDGNYTYIKEADGTINHRQFEKAK